jgi:hypothetical protein
MTLTHKYMTLTHIYMTLTHIYMTLTHIYMTAHWHFNKNYPGLYLFYVPKITTIYLT